MYLYYILTIRWGQSNDKYVYRCVCFFFTTSDYNGNTTIIIIIVDHTHARIMMQALGRDQGQCGIIFYCVRYVYDVRTYRKTSVKTSTYRPYIYGHAGLIVSSQMIVMIVILLGTSVVVIVVVANNTNLSHLSCIGKWSCPWRIV